MRDAVWLTITREQKSIPTTASTEVACRRHLGQEIPAGTLLSYSVLPDLEKHFIQGIEYPMWTLGWSFLFAGWEPKSSSSNSQASLTLVLQQCATILGRQQSR